MLLYIHPHFTDPGGGSRFVLETAERLSKRGTELIVLTQTAKKTIINDYPNINFSFIGGSLPNTLSHWLNIMKLYKKIDKKIDKIKPKILFPQVFPSNHWTFFYKRKHQNIPCIWMCQEPSAFIHDKVVINGLTEPMKTLAIISNPFFKPLDIKLSDYADEIISNSKFSSENIKRIYNRDSISISGLGVDVNKFRPTKNKEDYIFVASRLTKFKNVDIAVKAMRYLKKYKNLKLFIGASGEEEKPLKKLSRDIGVEKNVNFLGWISQKELKYYYSRSIATLFMSINEPCGLVPLESMASGTPTIATNTGGPKETILDGKTGFLVPPNNPKAVADKIELLYTNNSLLKKMSKYSRKHIENNFTWDVVVDKLSDIFKRYY